jgi:hypothetical protein
MVCLQTTHCAILLSLLGRRESVTEYSAPQWGQKKVPPSGTGPNRGTSAPPYTPSQYAPQREQIPAPSSRPVRNCVVRGRPQLSGWSPQVHRALAGIFGWSALVAKSSTATSRPSKPHWAWTRSHEAKAATQGLYAQWVAGFVSGVSWEADDPDILRRMDFNGLMAWMHDYCKANPLAKVTTGAAMLVQELRARRHGP